jgi:hypothetical protein
MNLRSATHGSPSPNATSTPVKKMPLRFPQSGFGAAWQVQSSGYLTVSLAVLPTVPRIAVSVATLFWVTADVTTVKVIDVAPAGMVTLNGTTANVESDVRETVSPPSGAGLLIVTEPVLPAAPMTVVGLTDSAVSVGAVTVRFADFVALPRVAEIFATES